MRPESAMPRPRRSPSPISGKARGLLAFIVVGLFALLLSVRGIANFVTDYLWFDAVGYSDVWSQVLASKIILAVIFIVLVLGVVLDEPVARRPFGAAVPRSQPRRRSGYALPRSHRVTVGARPIRRHRTLRDQHRRRRGLTMAQLAAVHQQRRLRRRTTHSSAKTSASTCSACRF